MDIRAHRILHLAKLFLDLSKVDRDYDNHYWTSRALTVFDDAMELACLGIARHKGICIKKKDSYPWKYVEKLCDGDTGIHIEDEMLEDMASLHQRRNKIKHNGEFENAKFAVELMDSLESAMDEVLVQAGLKPLSQYILSEAIESPTARGFLEAAQSAMGENDDWRSHVEIRKLMYWLIERHGCLVEKLGELDAEWQGADDGALASFLGELDPSDRWLEPNARDLGWQARHLGDIFSLIALDRDVASRELLLRGARPSDFFLILEKTPPVFYDPRRKQWLVQYIHSFPLTVVRNQSQILLGKALDIVTAWESHDRLVDYRSDEEGNLGPDSWMRGLYVDMETPAYRLPDRNSGLAFTLKPGYSYKALRITYGIGNATEYVEVEGIAYSEEGAEDEKFDRGYALREKIRGLESEQNEPPIRDPL